MFDVKILISLVSKNYLSLVIFTGPVKTRKADRNNIRLSKLIKAVARR